MKSIFIIAIILISFSNDSVSSDIFKTCYQFDSQKPQYNGREKASLIRNEIYIYDSWIYNCDTLLLSKLKDSTEKIKIGIVCANEYIKLQATVSEIFSIKDTIIFCIANCIYKYSFNGKEAKLCDSINLDSIFKKNKLYYFSRVKLIGNTVFGVFDFYNTHQNPTQTCFQWRVNLQNLKDIRFDFIDLPQGYFWTLFQPRHVIDNSKEFTIVSDITNYKIKFYDRNYKLVDSITRDIPRWQASQFLLEKFDKQKPQAVIQRLQMDSSKCLIHRVNFVNDSTIFVCYSMKPDIVDIAYEKMYYFYYDIWTKEGGAWVIKLKDFKFSDEIDPAEQCMNEPINAHYIILDDNFISLPYSYRENSKIYVRELK